MDNASPTVMSSRSSPALTAHRRVSRGHGVGSPRSRHSSPVTEQTNVVAWLKDIRLHKYSECLAKFTWDEVYTLLLPVLHLHTV